MHNGDDLIKKNIITVDEGRILGKTDDFYLDTNLTTITAVQLPGSGLFSRKVTLIQHNAVTLYGVDSVLVKQSDVVVDANDLPDKDNWLLRNDLKGRHIETPGGTKIGTVGDIIFNDSGRILGFSFGQLLVQGTLETYGAITRDCIIEVLNPDGIMTIDLSKAEQYQVGEVQPNNAAKADSAMFKMKQMESEGV